MPFAALAALAGKAFLSGAASSAGQSIFSPKPQPSFEIPERQTRKQRSLSLSQAASALQGIAAVQPQPLALSPIVQAFLQTGSG